jgi:urease accessory protein
MLTVNKLVPGGQGLAPVLLKRAPRVELDWDTRQKSRFDATDSSGRHLGVFLPRGSVVRGGDVLVCENGSLIRVEAAAQEVMVVRPGGDRGGALDLLRAAYHLGNRHVPLELQSDHLKLEPDHVLAGLLTRMHLVVTEERAAFEPEAGAYAETSLAHRGGHGHGHAHGRHQHHPARAHVHSHDHSNASSHEHAQGDAEGHRQDPAHLHGPGHGHGNR